MSEFFEVVSKVAVLVFVVTCMVTAGLGLAARDVFAPLRPRVILLALVLNFAVAPGLAFALVKLAALDRPYAIGLLLLSSAAGAPFLPKLAVLAKGDLALSVGLMLLLMVASVAFMPVALPLLIPGLAAGPWPLLRPLLFTMFVPLVFGMLVRSCSEQWAGRLRPKFAFVSNVSMVLTLVLLVELNFKAMMGTFGSGAVAVGVVFVSITTAIGYALGGPSARTRSVLALGTGQRNVAAALLVATENYSEEPGVAVMLIVSTLAGLLVLVPVARWCARRSATGENSTAPTELSAEERTP